MLSSFVSWVTGNPVKALGLAGVGWMAVRRLTRKPAGPETWEGQVREHGPLTELVPGLWEVTGTVEHMSMPRRMLIARLPDGSLALNSVVAVKEETMKDILALGRPAIMIIPNGFHRRDAAVYLKRFPDLEVFCPSGAKAGVQQVLGKDTPLSDVMTLPARFPGSLQVYPISGWNRSMANLFEVVIEYAVQDAQGGWAFTVTDSLFNLEPPADVFGKFFTMLFDNVSKTGVPVVSRLGKWFMMQKSAVADSFRQLSTRSDIRIIVPGHGVPFTGDCSAAFKEIADTLHKP